MTSWTDELRVLDAPSLFPAEAEAPSSDRLGFHLRRGGLGVFSAVYIRDPGVDPRYVEFRRWKNDPLGETAFLDSAVGQLVNLIRAWSPVLPSFWTVTCPPAGASEGKPYPGGILAKAVAERVDLDFVTCLERAKAKRWHHPLESLRQEPFTVRVVPPSVCLVVDDWISSGNTMKLSREALAARGAVAFGFTWGAD